jgi:hypothetical protein
LYDALSTRFCRFVKALLLVATAMHTIETGTQVYFVQSLMLLKRLAFQALEHTEERPRLGLESLMPVLVTKNLLPQLREVANASDEVYYELAQALKGNPLREVKPLLWQSLITELKAVWASLNTECPNESAAKSTCAEIFCARNRHERETLMYTEHTLKLHLGIDPKEEAVEFALNALNDFKDSSIRHASEMFIDQTMRCLRRRMIQGLWMGV